MGVWNRSARRSGGNRPTKIVLPSITITDAQILAQVEAIRAEFGEAGVQRYYEQLEKRAKAAREGE